MATVYGKYTDVRVDVKNQSNLRETSMVDIQALGNHIPVHTQGRGLAGYSSGSPQMNVTMELKMPDDAPELDLYEDWLTMQTIPVRLYRSNQVLSTTGVVQSIGERKGVNDAATQTITIHCAAKTWTNL